MTIKKFLPVFLLLAIFASAFAIAEDDPTYYEGTELELEISSSVDINRYSNSGFLDYVKVDLNYLPRESYRQKVVLLDTKPDAEIGDSITFTWEGSLFSPLDFALESVVETKADFYKIKKKVPFPPSGDYPIKVYEYTRETGMIDITDGIRSLAAGLAEGEDDLYGVVFNIGVWINQNIEYDLSSAGADAVLPASWVLKNKRGVCDELTNLFISMLRSLGVPARFVTGMSYTNSPEFEVPWGLHGWAEVYFEGYGWVPFDPTYGQLGFVDAGHIKLKHSADSNKSSTEYEWKGRFTDLLPSGLDMKVEVLKKGGLLPPLADLSVQGFDSKVGFGSYNYIEATVKNKYNYYVTTTLYLSVPKEIEMIDQNRVPVLLGPYEKKSVYFRVLVSKDLKKNLIYTFPAVVSTQRNHSVDTSFKAVYGDDVYSLEMINEIIGAETEEKRGLEDIDFFCVADPEQVDVNEKLTITCRASNKMDDEIKDLSICLLGNCQKLSLDVGEEKQVSFEKEFDSIGGKLLLLQAKNGAISKSSYLNILVLDAPLVNISDVSYPKSVAFKDDFSVNFTLSRESFAVPENVEVLFYHNKNSQRFEIESLESTLPVSIGLEGRMMKIKENTIRIVVGYSDKNGGIYTTEEEFRISLKKTTWLEKIQVFLNQLYLFLERAIEKI